MSFTALGWASRIRPERASDKLLLLALAECHNEEHGLSWPSVAWLVEFTRLDRKTVIAGVKRLAEAGYIIDSGKRVGKTKQIIAWSLPSDRNNTVIPDKNPVIPIEQSRNRNPEPIKEPIKNASEDARANLSDDWQPSEKLRSRLDGAYPHVDVDEQIRAFILNNRAKGVVIRNADAAFEAWMSRIASLRLPVKARAPVAGGSSADPATVARSLTDNVQFYIRQGRHEEAALTAAKLVSAQCLAGDDGEGRKALMLAIDQWRAAHDDVRADELEGWGKAQWGQEWRKIDGASKDQDDKGPGDRHRHAAGRPG